MSKTIPILYGTESGNAEYCAETLADSITEAGYRCEAIDLDDYDPPTIATEELVIIVTSTHGNGDPPGNAAALMRYLKSSDADLSGLKFAVCGLGDTSFAYFAQCGKDFDAILEKLGGQRVLDRVDCKEDFDDDFDGFMDTVKGFLEQQKNELTDWAL